MQRILDGDWVFAEEGLDALFEAMGLVPPRERDAAEEDLRTVVVTEPEGRDEETEGPFPWLLRAEPATRLERARWAGRSGAGAFVAAEEAYEVGPDLDSAAFGGFERGGDGRVIAYALYRVDDTGAFRHYDVFATPAEAAVSAGVELVEVLASVERTLQATAAWISASSPD